MKATFEFLLPEDQYEYETYRRAPGFYHALGELRRWLRQKRKHGDSDTIGLDEVWDEFHRICQEFADDL